MGTSTLGDSLLNKNNGVINIDEGATLTIKKNGTLNLIPNKFVGIYGTKTSSLIIDGGLIKINSTEDDFGRIYIGRECIFNGGIFYFTALSGNYPPISSNNSIIINKGKINIQSKDRIEY